MTDRLGILVHTDRHPDYVRELARAARRRRKQIHVHFTGDGLTLADHPSLAGLAQEARVTWSAGGRSILEHPEGLAERDGMDLARFFDSCDRCVVF